MPRSGELKNGKARWNTNDDCHVKNSVAFIGTLTLDASFVTVKKNCGKLEQAAQF